MRTRTLARFLLVVGSLSMASPAAAQSADTTAAGARAILERATRHYEAQRWALAAEAYLEFRNELLELGNERAPLALWNAGLSLAHLPQREQEALRLFRQFIAESHDLTDDAAVRDMRSEAQSRIAELERRNPSSSSSSSLSAPSGDIGPLGVTGIALLAAGGAVGVASLATGLLAHDAYETLSAACGPAGECPPGSSSQIDEGTQLALASTVTFPVAVALLATGVVLTIVEFSGGESPSAEAARLQLTPLGLQLGGSF